MPLLDHFRPPIGRHSNWDMVHGQLPGVITQHLNRILPARYAAGPTVHIRSGLEIDIAAFLNDLSSDPAATADSGGVATATAVWTEAEPTLQVIADWSEVDDYEVLIYDHERGRELVATIEIVSPSNKDRPDHRRLFAGKCATLLKRGVSVTVVDFVTDMDFNLYAEMMALVGRPDPAVGDPPVPIYAVSMRERMVRRRRRLESWFRPLAVGQPLPQLPLWLTERLVLPLDLEPMYTDTLQSLRII